ncbi:MAG: YtxH domain-containing protein [Anaerolineae bacterium]
MRVLRFIEGFTLGAALGGILGLLLAPYSGVESRERIRAYVDEVIAEARRASEEKRRELEERLAAAKQGR